VQGIPQLNTHAPTVLEQIRRSVGPRDVIAVRTVGYIDRDELYVSP
jgi:hypothetical protein